MTGVDASTSSRRSSARTSMPLRRGIITSSITRSGRRRRAISSDSMPSSASANSYGPSRLTRISSRRAGSSSQMSTVARKPVIARMVRGKRSPARGDGSSRRNRGPIFGAWPLTTMFGFATMMVGAIVGGVIGYLIGDTRAFLARLQGQTALAQIEAAKDARLALEAIQQIHTLATRRAAAPPRPQAPAPTAPQPAAAPVEPPQPVPMPLAAAAPVELAPAPPDPPAPPALVVAGAAPPPGAPPPATPPPFFSPA